MARKIAWQPQMGPQTAFVLCPAFEVMYGGAVGGGKTDALLGDFAEGIDKYGAAWRGVFFRRHFPDMDDVIARSREIYGPVYGDKCYNASKFIWNFPSGATLSFRALEKDNDVYKYQGQQFSWVGWDELTQWPTPFPYTFMMTRARSAKGAPVRIRSATNPGSVGHHWVKARFIDIGYPNIPQKIRTRSGESYYRVFIPAKLEDNQVLMKADPAYADRVFELHDERYAEALRYGDWNIVAGAAFTEWRQHIHVIPNGPVPLDRPIMRGLDWGYKKPYGALWGWQTNDGDVIWGGELYGYGGNPNVGSEEQPEVVLEKILAWEQGWEIPPTRGWIDGQTDEEAGAKDSIFRRLGGRRMWKPWPKGPNSRVNQKQLLHQFLSVTNDKTRMMFMERCAHTIRTLPTLPSSKTNLEDIDTDSEDHLYDVVRGVTAAKFMPSKKQIQQQQMRRRMARMEMNMDQPDCGGF